MHKKKHNPQVSGGDLSPSLCTCETSCRVMHPSLGPPAQEWQWHGRVGTERGHKKYPAEKNLCLSKYFGKEGGYVIKLGHFYVGWNPIGLIPMRVCYLQTEITWGKEIQGPCIHLHWLKLYFEVWISNSTFCRESQLPSNQGNRPEEIGKGGVWVLVGFLFLFFW